MGRDCSFGPAATPREVAGEHLALAIVSSEPASTRCAVVATSREVVVVPAVLLSSARASPALVLLLESGRQRHLIKSAGLVGRSEAAASPTTRPSAAPQVLTEARMASVWTLLECSAGRSSPIGARLCSAHRPAYTLALLTKNATSSCFRAG